MSLFNHHVTFKKVDPLGDGLADDIASEKNDPEAIVLEEGTDENQFVQRWEEIAKDVEKDPSWFKIADEDSQ